MQWICVLRGGAGLTMGLNTSFHYKTLFSVACQILTSCAEIFHDRCQPHPGFFEDNFSYIVHTPKAAFLWKNNVHMVKDCITLLWYTGSHKRWIKITWQSSFWSFLSFEWLTLESQYSLKLGIFEASAWETQWQQLLPCSNTMWSWDKCIQSAFMIYGTKMDQRVLKSYLIISVFPMPETEFIFGGL